MKIELTRDIFDVYYQALAVGQRQSNPTEWPDIVDLVKRLKAVGVSPGKDAPDDVLVLADGKGAIELDNAQVRILGEFIDSTPWRPLSLEKVLKAKERLARGGN